MIKLNVEEKCQNCPYFTPGIERTDITALGDKNKRLMQEIYCENKDFCDNIEVFLKQEMQ
ncbi:MAG: hypothetical protein ACLRZ9_05775 [Eubacterium sp.]